MNASTGDAHTTTDAQRLDDALDDSFPASDPPAMTDPTRRTGEPMPTQRPGGAPDMPGPAVDDPEDRPLPAEDVPAEVPPRHGPPYEPPVPAEMPPRDDPRRPTSSLPDEVAQQPFSSERLSGLCWRLMADVAGRRQ